MLVEGLRVYNCLTNKLEEATTHTKYIALSYVWGSFPDISCRKPPEQCRTIRDAMQVVLRLGYEYLWVNQLCINQAGPHKLQQIQQMNRIYQNADLTIVAAAGDNSDFGIPGVQDRSRLGRERFKIGNLQFIETVQHPHTLLSRTAWKSRAWTFQEEKLSHRLLVFTERAAWFSCYITSAEEGFEAKNRVNYEIPSLQAKLALAEKTPRPPCGLEAPLDIDRLIEEYAVRLLTYTSDVVNAFSGILEELKGANLIVSHVWGSPIMPPIALPDSANRYHRRPEVVDLVRSTVDGFIVGLMWNTTRPESFIRRHGIPSWSWVGWRGEILLRELYEEENVNFGIEVFIERTDGQVLTWSEFEGLSYLENQSHLISRFIRLRAWTMDLRIEYHHFTKGYLSAYAVMQMLNGDELLREASILGEPRKDPSKERLDEVKGRVYTGVCLFPTDKTCRSRLYVMLLDKVDGSFQRIGHFEVDHWSHLRQTSLSGKTTYRDFDLLTGQLGTYDRRTLGSNLNARMEEVRIG